MKCCLSEKLIRNSVSKTFGEADHIDTLLYQHSRLPEGKQVISINHMMLGWPKCLFGFFHDILLENPKE